MAEEKESVENTAENAVYDPELDFFSASFNPIKALSTPGLEPPIKSAKTLDNIAKYETAYLKPTIVQKKKDQGASTSASNAPIARKFLPHQCELIYYTFHSVFAAKAKVRLGVCIYSLPLKSLLHKAGLVL